MSAVLLVYALGAVVFGLLMLAHFATDGNGPTDFADAVVAAFFGFTWPITAPFFIFAAVLMMLGRLIASMFGGAR